MSDTRPTVVDVGIRTESDVNDDPLAVLWGKSDAGGAVHLLLGHLLDTAAVAERMWDGYLAPRVRDAVDRCNGGRGRELFSLACGLHDIGKASPAFQSKSPELAAAVQATGLTWSPLTREHQRWHHTTAGAVIWKRYFTAAGWNTTAVGWTWPLIAGHHGKVPGARALDLTRPRGRANAQGQTPAWIAAQDAVITRVLAELKIDAASVAPSTTPFRAEQLALSGAIIMADWIASNDALFTGLNRPKDISIISARERAERGWAALHLRGGWDPATLPVHEDPVRARFGMTARAAQRDAVSLAERMPGPGLLILEAPMGEGKTEAALACAEVLARRFGADGLFVGMPTQATSDPMYTRVRQWAEQVQPDLPLALLHGKRQFNREWAALTPNVTISGVDEYGCDDDFGASGTGSSDDTTSRAPADWFLAHKRGLLTPLAVGTIDQLLHAVTRTKHVALRHAGVAGRVVLLDEVHSYDVYMSQFLREALRWLSDAGVPVVLLSATLAPAVRRDLVRAYLQGTSQQRDVDIASLPAAAGYPQVTSACWVGGTARFGSAVSVPWRPSADVSVEVLGEGPTDGPEAVVARVTEAVADGGCVLVIRNTVRRAQETYSALRDRLGDDAVLLHARLTAGERADRSERVLDLLGRPGRAKGAQRPHRLVVVATQLAEQSFDVDVDLLVTDHAPIDLLLQRVGRLHRHDRTDRNQRLSTPHVIVAGLAGGDGAPPRFPGGSSFVYEDHLLLRSAVAVLGAVLGAASGGGWSVPADVPRLVAEVYGGASIVPDTWTEAAEKAHLKADEDASIRAARAAQFLLAGEDKLGTPTLAGLHDLSSNADLDDETRVAAVVRDGEPSVEVVLVRRDDVGYRALDGTRMGVNGEAVSDADVAELVVRCSVRLPAYGDLTRDALDQLQPLPGWGTHPWLRRARALVLDETGRTTLGRHRLTYDDDLGLVVERSR